MMISKVEMEAKPWLQKKYMNAIFFIVITNVLYLVPIVFLITVGSLNSDDKTDLPSWTFYISSFMLTHLLIHWYQIIHEAEYRKSDFEKCEEKEKKYRKKLKALTDSKKIFMGLYFVAIIFVIGTCVPLLDPSNRHFYFYLELLVFCSIALVPYVVIASHYVYLNFELWNNSLHDKVVENVVLLV